MGDPKRRLLAGAAVAVALLAVLPYLPGLPGDFVYDDHRLITENEGLRRPFDPARAFARDYYASDVDRMGLGYYRPVAILLNEADWRRGGGESLPFHSSNIALHVLCSLLVLAIAWRLGGGRVEVAVAAGALFAVHAAHAETVAFISGRVDALAAFFGLGAVLVHLSARGRREAVGSLGVAGLWLLALLSKEMSITIPVLLLLLDGAAEGWAAWRPASLLRRYTALGLGAAVYLAARWTGLGHLLSASPDGAPPFDPARSAGVLASYLRWLVLPPPGLHLEPELPTGAGAAALAAATLAVAALAFAWSWRRGHRLQAGLLAWCVASLLPVAQVRPIETSLSERFLYLPSVGACLLLGTFARRPGRRALAAVPLLLVPAHLAILVPRSVLWRDEVALWTRQSAERPEDVKPALNLARAEAGRGNEGAARQAYERAARLSPGMAPDIRAEMAALAGSRVGADPVQALEEALVKSPLDGSLWNNLGFARLPSDPAGALDAFRRSVEVAPGRSSPWVGASLAHLRRGEWAEAEAAAAQALALNPELDLPRGILVECAYRRGDPCGALARGQGIRLSDPAAAAQLQAVLQRSRAECPDPGASRLVETGP